MPTKPSQQLDDLAAATRHAVYEFLFHFLPYASFDQARQFAANLRIRGHAPLSKAAALQRFTSLRVTPDICETHKRPATIKEIETWLNKRYGDRLYAVAGFYRRGPSAPFRLNLPEKCVLYGYRSATGFLTGILCQPVNALDKFFLLSSSKFGGPKAVRMTPRDQQYFTQYEEVNA